MGLPDAVLAFLIAGLLLTFLGSCTAIVSAKTRLTTYMLAQFAFGPVGGKFVNMVLATTMFGWFGVNAFMFAEACQSMIWNLTGFHFSYNIYIIIGSVLMVATTIFGFKALDKLALVAVPILLFILITVLVISFTKAEPGVLLATHQGTMSFGLAVSATAGGNMVMVAAMPDVARYISGKGQAVLAMFISFTLAAPLILTAAAVPSLVTGESDLLKILMGLGFGVPALLVLVLSTWTANASNLYGAGLGLAATFIRIPQWKLMIGAGLAGMAIAMLGIVNHFIPFLLFLGILIPPVAGIYVAFYILYPDKMKDVSEISKLPGTSIPAFTAWGIGVAVATATAFDFFTLTTIPSCDALITSVILYMPLEYMLNARRSRLESQLVRRY
nr:cytosine permease [Govania unica]